MDYFLAIDGTQIGPFAVAELAVNGMRPHTPVWRKGLSRWQRADSVAELRPFFSSAIPDSPSHWTHSKSPSSASPRAAAGNRLSEEEFQFLMR